MAREQGAQAIFSGYGGDQLFYRTNGMAREPLTFL